jgi:salicylate hydroxylase
MTRILNHWGLAPCLVLTAVKCPQFRFHQADGALLSIVQLLNDFLRDLMVDFVFVWHRDLHEMLLELAVQAGVRVRWGAVVKTVDCDSLSVMLDDGSGSGGEERLHADVVVGADGPNSIVGTRIGRGRT